MADDSLGIHVIAFTGYYVIWQMTRQLIHVATGQCMQKNMTKEESTFVKLAPCEENSVSQRWTLERRKDLKHIRQE